MSKAWSEQVESFLSRVLALGPGDTSPEAFLAEHCDDPAIRDEVLRRFRQAGGSLPRAGGGRVFISYASAERDQAEEVCAGLEARGLRCWMAPRDILPGAAYADAIVEAVDQAAALIVVFTPSVNQSPHILREVERAVGRKCPLINLKLCEVETSKALSYFLNVTQRLDATEMTRSSMLEILAAAVQRIVSQRVAVETVLTEERTRVLGGSSAAPARLTSAPGIGKDEEPETIGDYRVLKRLGGGGMGVVYLAMKRDDQFKRRVAIKLVKRGMDSEQVLKRFELEKQVLVSLTHPNISRFLEAGITRDGRPYFVMEFIEGQTLLEYCDSNQLSLGERLKLFTRVCSAVHAAHQSQVVHRDIKPGNILVGADGEPKLLDFGIAKLLGQGGSDVVTMELQRLMTPEYASPEQVKGEPITTASDVYSLGVLLYELLTGVRPYAFKSRLEKEVVRVISEEEPRRPSTAISDATELATDPGTTPGSSTGPVTGEAMLKTRAKLRSTRPDTLRRELSNDLDDIVLMAMRKSPKRRYTSAEQMAEDIRRHLSGQTVIARPETMSYVVGKFVKRNRIAVGTAAAFVIVLAGSAVGMGLLWRQAVAARLVAQQRTEEADAARAQSIGAIRKYFGSVFGAIKALPGGQDALVSMSDAIITSFEKGIGDPSPQNRAIRVQLGRAYDEKSLALGGLQSANQGDRLGAVRASERAVELLDGCVKEEPEDWEALVNLSWALQNLGNVRMLALQCERVQHEFERAVEVGSRARVAAEKSRNTRARVDANETWALALHKVAESVLWRGDPGKAQGLFQETAEVLRANARERESALTMHTYGVVFTKLALCEERAGRLDAALQQNQKAMECRLANLEKYPSNPTARRDVPITRERVGSSLTQLGRCSEAESELRKALAEIEELSRDSKNESRTAWDTIRIRVSLARALKCLSKSAEARALALGAAELAEKRPEDHQNLETLADALDVAGDLAEGAEAQSRWDRSLSAWRKLRVCNPDNVYFAEREQAVATKRGAPK